MAVEPTNSGHDLVNRVEENLGYRFQDSTLLRTALTHPSFSAENKSYKADNQRLEFLGDAVLDLVLSHEMYLRFPDAGEGVLTKWRARLVSKPALAEFGRRFKLGELILMGKGDDASGGRSRPSTLADCVEAVLGAVYLDGGLEVAREVILLLVGSALEEVTQSVETENPKGELQEILQVIQPESPVYAIVSASGPDHDKKFVSAVTWGGVLLGTGEGESKKLSEMAAAADALRGKKWLEGSDA